MYIDIHSHLDLCENIEGTVEKSKKNDVKIILTNGVNPETNKKTLELSQKNKEVKACLGIYPIDALKLSDKEIDDEIKFIEKNKDNIVAIGEVGMDFKEDQLNHEKQIKNFEKFIKLSIKLNKPIIIHSRKAEKECIEILEKNKAKKVIMHCFSGNFNLIKRIKENNWYLTIPSNVTFSEHFQKIAQLIPLEQLFCETDSPYLHPNKERNNIPANVIESYKKLAEIKKLPLNQVEKQIEENYNILFS